jgi:hypothetical protein
MAGEARRPELRDAMDAFLAEQAGYARYRRSQWEATRGARRPAGGPRPLEFDEGGFPIPQRQAGFADRVARLIRAF